MTGHRSQRVLSRVISPNPNPNPNPKPICKHQVLTELCAIFYKEILSLSK